MQVLQGLSGLDAIPAGAVMTVGNFDGVHLGHQRLLAQARQRASVGRPLVVVTFEPHPLAVLRPQLAPPRLTPIPVKHRLLESAGVDVLVELPPSRDVLQISAMEFCDLLAIRLNVAHLIEGPDFSFGKGRQGTIDNLRAWTAGTPMQVDVVDQLTVAITNLHLVEVRSSLIRWLVAYGRVRDAAICLGRPYTLCGQVIKGYQRGRTIGFPTANFDCGQQLVPDDGVYVGRCSIHGQVYPAAVSIGTMPTFGENKRQIEAHLLGFEGDLYDQSLELELVDFLRDQRKFASLEQLKLQLRQDMLRVASQATADPTRPVVRVA